MDKNVFKKTTDLDKEQLLSRSRIREIINVSDMTIWRWERCGLFPKHITFSKRNYWKLSDILDWINIHTSKGVE